MNGEAVVIVLYTILASTDAADNMLQYVFGKLKMSERNMSPIHRWAKNNLGLGFGCAAIGIIIQLIHVIILLGYFDGQSLGMAFIIGLLAFLSTITLAVNLTKITSLRVTLEEKR